MVGEGFIQAIKPTSILTTTMFESFTWQIEIVAELGAVLKNMTQTMIQATRSYFYNCGMRWVFFSFLVCLSQLSCPQPISNQTSFQQQISSTYSW